MGGTGRVPPEISRRMMTAAMSAAMAKMMAHSTFFKGFLLSRKFLGCNPPVGRGARRRGIRKSVYQKSG